MEVPDQGARSQSQHELRILKLSSQGLPLLTEEGQSTPKCFSLPS